MKKILLTTIIIVFITIICQLNAQNPCEPVGCDGIWHDAPTFFYYSPMFPGCEIQISSDFMDCNNATYFRLTGVAFEWSDECMALFNFLVPFGNYADGRNLSIIWRDAFEPLTRAYFRDFHLQHPNEYICPSTYSCKSITPGGCNSARWAFRLPSPEHPGTWIHLKYAPCEENGCCITETIWCWNEVTNSEEFISENTQYFSEGDCFNKLPLYNPFEGYGPEWIISPPSPCGLSCYIDN